MSLSLGGGSNASRDTPAAAPFAPFVPAAPLLAPSAAVLVLTLPALDLMSATRQFPVVFTDSATRWTPAFCNSFMTLTTTSYLTDLSPDMTTGAAGSPP